MDSKLTIAFHAQWKKTLADKSKRNVYTWENQASIEEQVTKWEVKLIQVDSKAWPYWQLEYLIFHQRRRDKISANQKDQN